MSSVAAAVFLALLAGVAAAEQPRISIPELLAPATRVRALHTYLVAAEKEQLTPYEIEDVEKFEREHPNIRVSELNRPGQLPRYLVVWAATGYSGDASWNTVERQGWGGARQVTENAPLLPDEMADYRIFSSDGVLIGDAKRSFVHSGLIGDFNQDGEPEVIEDVRIPGGLDLDADGVESPDDARVQYEWLAVRPPEFGSAPTLAILFNAHPAAAAPANTWGFQVRPVDGRGEYVIELGPVRVSGGVTPEATFRWDRTLGRWEGPPAKPDDHFRVLAPTEEVLELARRGGLRYPLVPVSLPPAPDLQPADMSIELDSVEPERLSKPYRYASLKALTNDELFAWMTKRKTAWDYQRERLEDATTVPEFWKLSPRQAALAYVMAHRPAALRLSYLVDFGDPPAEAPPLEGDVTLTDRRSGCFAPAGAYVHHLHCARDGSFLAYAEIEHNYFTPPLPTPPVRMDFRRVELRYEDALQVLQTLWWMSAIRSRKLLEGGSEGASRSSTSDGYATVVLSGAGGKLTVSGLRVAEWPSRHLGVSETNGHFGTSGFINLAVQLFRREVPARLGAAWKAQGVTKAFDETTRAPLAHSPEELAREKARLLELLQLFKAGKLPPSAMEPVMTAIGEMGWRDLREEVVRLGSLLPPPSPYEQRLAALEAELKRWREKLGPKAEDSASDAREQKRLEAELKRWDEKLRAKTDDRAPNAREQKRDEPLLPPASEEDAALAEYDRLRARRYRLDGTEAEEALKELRWRVERVLRQLETFDDPAELLRWHGEDEWAGRFVRRRLAELDRPRAIALLRQLEEKHAHSERAEHYRSERLYLEAMDAPPSGEADAVRRALAILEKAAPEPWELHGALETLVPPDEPHRYAAPEIDRFLQDALEHEKDSTRYLRRDISAAAAHRLGLKAWEPLMAQTKSDPSELDDLVPALTIIAGQAPALHRAEMRELLSQELQTSRGWIDTILLAIWELDLRELKGEIERLATSGPADYDGPLASSWSSQAKPVRHRYHLARQIASLWNEEDPLTRAKLLAAFAVARSEGSHAAPAAGRRAKAALGSARAELSAAHQRELDAFSSWCEARVREGRR